LSERRAYRITGRVQGVGFRWWARQEATRLGLRGTVANDPDGTVRLEADGEPEELGRLEGLLRQGPPGARVAAVSRAHPSDGPLPAGFDIVR
jgi:acylphosphatase